MALMALMAWVVLGIVCVFFLRLRWMFGIVFGALRSIAMNNSADGEIARAALRLIGK